MKRLLSAALLSVGIWGLSAGQALAQLGYYVPPQINPRPAISPYLNLANGTNPATTYFGIVRPQIDMGNNIQSLQQQLQGIQENSFAQTGMGFNQLGFGNGVDNGFATGHPVVFQNHSFYYPLLNRNGNTNRPGVFNNNRR